MKGWAGGAPPDGTKLLAFERKFGTKEETFVFNAGASLPLRENERDWLEFAWGRESQSDQFEARGTEDHLSW